MLLTGFTLGSNLEMKAATQSKQLTLAPDPLLEFSSLRSGAIGGLPILHLRNDKITVQHRLICLTLRSASVLLVPASRIVTNSYPREFSLSSYNRFPMLVAILPSRPHTHLR